MVHLINALIFECFSLYSGLFGYQCGLDSQYIGINEFYDSLCIHQLLVEISSHVDILHKFVKSRGRHQMVDCSTLNAEQKIASAGFICRLNFAF